MLGGSVESLLRTPGPGASHKSAELVRLSAQDAHGKNPPDAQTLDERISEAPATGERM